MQRTSVRSAVGSANELAAGEDGEHGVEMEEGQPGPVGVNLCFEDLTVTLPARKAGGTPLQVVSHVSGVAKSGDLVGIMGPSGAGKSSLLDTLAGRKTVGVIEGSIRVNGEVVTARTMRRFGGYVAQEDTLMETLTVLETLTVVARLQLPFTLTREQLDMEVHSMLSALRLDECAHTRVGGQLIRGVSGGQRRRLSIAVELIRKPKVVFLDEPTTGLDSASALVLFDILNNLKRTMHASVVCTIHQPRASIFLQFDSVILLHKGQTMFAGPVQQAIAHFQAFGHTCPFGWNIADFLIDVISDPEVPAVEWATRFRASDVGRALDNQARRASSPSPFSRPRTRRMVTPMHYQILVLAHRELLGAIRNPFVVVGQLSGYVAAATGHGLLFSDIKVNKASQMTLSFSFVVAIIAIFSFFAVPSYNVKRALFAREYADGLYRLPSYYLANVLVQTAINLPIVAIYTTMLYFIQGWHGSLGAYLALNTLLMLGLMAMNEAIGATFRNLFVALACSALVSVNYILFAGVIALYDNIPSYLQWLFWVSPCSYATAGMVAVYFGDGSPESEAWLSVFHSPLQGVSLGETCAVLLGFFVVYRVACIAVLRGLHHEAR